MKYIKLSQGETAHIDDEDMPLVEGHRWFVRKHSEKLKYAVANIKNKSIPMHRLLMGNPHGMIVDHVDGNGLNNTRSNLRLCTQKENGRNRSRLQSRNKSGAHGVYWVEKWKTWRVRITVDGCYLHVGYFKELSSAIQARKDAEAKNYGDFAPGATSGS